MVDEKGTESNVRKYLEKEFPRLVLQAGYSMLDVQSPKFDITGGGGHSVRNSIEDKIDGHFYAEQLVSSTIRSIRKCPIKCQRILYDVYVKGRNDIDVQLDLKYEHAQYNVVKNKAFLYFADSFQRVHDFHEYMNDDDMQDWKSFV